MEYPVENLCYNRSNDLVAISSSDLSLTILNVKNGLKKVRTFLNAAENKITDICFSQPDSKWLICSSLDKSVKVYDILTGTLIDWIRFSRAPLSLDFALSGEFLATSHVGSKAVYLWSNRSYFENIVIQRVPTKPTLIDLPVLSSHDETVKESHKDFYKETQSQQIEEAKITKNIIDQAFEQTKKQTKVVDSQKSKLIGLSDQPYSKWQAIFNLEQIKERNKPTLAKQELPKAPFFLFDLDKVMAGESNTVPNDLLKQTYFSKTEEKTTH